MIYEPSWLAIGVFTLFVGFTLGLSFYLGRNAKSSAGYFAAHGQIPWFVNGIAFAGDYLSAASFLGICGMIAFYGYDGFLYSIGYLAGWIVALFVIAEPMKRFGKFTFADALDARFHSRGIKLVAGISTLVVSLFYLIPQMVGAGVLIQPLLGFPHWVGVVLVGATVIVIVVTAGMVSTTYVQFLKGSLLVFFAAILAWIILARGFEAKLGGNDGYAFKVMGPATSVEACGVELLPADGGWEKIPFVRSRDADGRIVVWHVETNSAGEVTLRESQTVTQTVSGVFVNGQPLGRKPGEAQLHPVGYISRLPGDVQSTGGLGPLSFFSTLQQSEVVLWEKAKEKVAEADGGFTTIYYPKLTPGSRVLRPGEHPTFQGIRSEKIFDKLNFLSLMLALFCGTASLPHILIRYYTVKDERSARRSTIVGIASIGCFYVLTLYLGLGAMTSGALDVTNSNMAAPLLAKGLSEWLFAIISAIAFTTVLGTVSGLILASSGAVTHDLLMNVLGWKLTDHEQVRVAKLTSVVVGAVAIVLGILFEKMNVSYLVGWAFSVAASANLPSLVMVLFWQGVTRQGVIAAVAVGMTTSLAWILLSAESYTQVYGLSAANAWVPFSQPGIITIPLGFLTLVAVSLLTGRNISPAVVDGT
ncbi:MAG: cation acetate symporter [Planctomycetota bacterium]|nr:cation acetate symporter [Planctomycetota bacterium]MDA1178564.1 cation acetate symporter [Planctomycetota bacterium]